MISFGEDIEYEPSPYVEPPARPRRSPGHKGANRRRRIRPFKFGYVDYLIARFGLVRLSKNDISLTIKDNIDELKDDLEQQLYVGIKHKLEDMEEEVTEEKILEVSRDHKFQADVNDMFDNPRMFNKLIQTIFERTQNLPDTLEDNNDLSIFLNFYRQLYSKLKLEEMGREGLIEERVARLLQRSYRKRRGERELRSIYSSYGPLVRDIQHSIPRINNVEALRYEYRKNTFDFKSWWDFRNYIHKLDDFDRFVINFLCTGHPLREPDFFDKEICTPDEFIMMDLEPLVMKCYNLLHREKGFHMYWGDNTHRKFTEVFRAIQEQTRRFKLKLDRVDSILSKLKLSTT